MAAASGSSVETVDHVGRLLAAAAGVTELVLAVAVHGILSRRPEAREALLSVWKAEEATGGAAALQAVVTKSAAGKTPLRTPTPVPEAAEAVREAAAATSLAPTWQPTPQKAACSRTDLSLLAASTTASAASVTDASSAAAQPLTSAWPPAALQLLADAHGYAIRAGDEQIGTEHVLAASVYSWPEDSRRAFGVNLHEQLVDLLGKSSLGQVASAEAPQVDVKACACAPDAWPLLGVLCGHGPDRLFKALEDLPDCAAATQLLEMSRIFAQRAAPLEVEAEFVANSVLSEFDAMDALSARFCGPAAAIASASAVAAVRQKAQQSAVAAQAKVIGTSHILVAALACFPEAAQSTLGAPLQRQLLEVLQKSHLALPAEDAPLGASLPISADAEALCDFESPELLFKAVQELPDASAATQLIEISRVYLNSG